MLREFPKKEKKTASPKAPSLESLKLWELEGISRRTWYRRRKAEREALKKEEAKKQLLSIEHEKIIAKVIEKIVRIVYKKETIGTARAYIMRRGRGEDLFDLMSLREFRNWGEPDSESDNREFALSRGAVGQLSKCVEEEKRGNADTHPPFLQVFDIRRLYKLRFAS